MQGLLLAAFCTCAVSLVILPYFDVANVPVQTHCASSTECCHDILPGNHDLDSCYSNIPLHYILEGHFDCCEYEQVLTGIEETETEPRDDQSDINSDASDSDSDMKWQIIERLGPFTMRCPKLSVAVMYENGEPVARGGHDITKIMCCELKTNKIVKQSKDMLARLFPREGLSMPFLRQASRSPSAMWSSMMCSDLSTTSTIEFGRCAAP